MINLSCTLNQVFISTWILFHDAHFPQTQHRNSFDHHQNNSMEGETALRNAYLRCRSRYHINIFIYSCFFAVTEDTPCQNLIVTDPIKSSCSHITTTFRKPDPPSIAFVTKI